MEKKKNKLEKLRGTLEKYKNYGFFKTSNSIFFEKTQDRISKVLQEEFNKLFSKEKINAQRWLRKKFLNLRDKSIFERNIGLSTWRLKDLNPVFREEYQKAIVNSLGLIKTQNEENMLKLKRRFFDWVTLQSQEVKGDAVTLKSLVKLPKDKKVKFILKDQTNKLASAMDSIVAKEFKAIAFQWKIRKDNRVVGKPGGVNPKGSKVHGNHYIRSDKWYYYKQTPYLKELNLSKFAGSAEDIEDGLPGFPIGCRCWAKNVYRLEDLPKELVKWKAG